MIFWYKIDGLGKDFPRYSPICYVNVSVDLGLGEAFYSASRADRVINILHKSISATFNNMRSNVGEFALIILEIGPEM